MFYIIIPARTHDYGRQKANEYDDDYGDDFYSYDNSAAMSFSGFGGVSYNPNEDDDDSEEDESDSDDEDDTEEDEDSATDDEKDADSSEQVGEITNGVGNL